jgi:hypothetical protein
LSRFGSVLVLNFGHEEKDTLFSEVANYQLLGTDAIKTANSNQVVRKQLQIPVTTMTVQVKTIRLSPSSGVDDICSSLIKLRHSDACKPMFFNFSKVGSLVLVLPHSNAAEERSFIARYD